MGTCCLGKLSFGSGVFVGRYALCGITHKVVRFFFFFMFELRGVVFLPPLKLSSNCYQTKANTAAAAGLCIRGIFAHSAIFLAFSSVVSQSYYNRHCGGWFFLCLSIGW